MNDGSKNIRGLGFIILAVVAVVYVAKAMSPREIVPWRTDFAAASAEAAKAGKPLFIDFTASWCGPCQRLKSTTWADESVAKEMQKYVPVQVDIDANPELARKYQVDSIPAFFVVDVKEGKVLKAGGNALDPEEFLGWIRG